MSKFNADKSNATSYILGDDHPKTHGNATALAKLDYILVSLIAI